MLLEKVKGRCGIAQNITVYDEEIEDYINDCMNDMAGSGVPESVIKDSDSILTAVTLYVKAYLGNDRSDTDKYLELYRNKVFRMTLDGE